MQRKSTLLILVLFVLSSVVFVPPATAEGASERYTINFNGNQIPADAAQLVAAAGGQLVRTLPEVGIGVAVSSDPNFMDNLSSARAVHSVGPVLQHSLPIPAVVKVEDGHPPTAFLYDEQWNIRRVKADLAWDINTGSHDTVVAVLDTGVAWNHPDLGPNVVYTACYSTQPTCSEYPDIHWHGTHVAGTVAATFDFGVVGVGPNLGIASYNVFEFVPGVGVIAFDDPLWSAMIDAANQGFDVINMSLGGYLLMSEGKEHAAAWTAWNRVSNYVIRQGVTIVASAGNGDFDMNGPWKHIPGDVPGIINVAATGIRPEPEFPQPGFWDVRAFYSNYGAVITLAAPGGDCGLDDSCDPATRPANWFDYLILSTYVVPDPACAATASCPIGWAWAAGTSMAAPHVSGGAGLLIDHNPYLNPNQVRSTLMRTAEDIGSRQFFGHGMLDVYSALGGN
jgi:lantibiotic leader peptide-processing serine protease